MLKQITLFFNTGFNAINFPANPQTLYLFENRQYPVMDLVQENFLSSIKIKATEDDIIDADYLRIGNAYYSINSYVMTSTDVVSFSVTQNAILSVGGIDELEYITGEVSRSTALDYIDMNFEDYTLQDELLSYSERRPTVRTRAFDNMSNVPLHQATYKYPWPGDEAEAVNIYTSVYDDNVPEEPSETDKNALLGEAGAAIWNTLETAWVGARTFDTFIHMVGHDAMQSSNIVYEMPGVSMYTGAPILYAARVMNGFGINNFILDSYSIPAGFVDCNIGYSGHVTDLIGKSNRAYVSLGLDYESVLGKDWQLRELNPIIKDVIANQAIEVTIESMVNGANNTVRMAELSRHANPGAAENNVFIGVDMIADPSPTGAPYFKLVTKERYGDSGTVDGNVIDIMMGSIRGATWMRNPILFDGYGKNRDMLLLDSQNALRSTMFEHSVDYQDSAYWNDIYGRVVNTATLGLVDTYKGNANWENAHASNTYDFLLNWDGKATTEADIMTRAHQRLSGANSSNLGIGVGFFTTALGNIVQSGQSRDLMQAGRTQSIADMGAQRNAELQQFAITHPGFQFELRYPISDNGQLLYGNGIMITVRSMSENDLNRYIRILQQYGIACTGKMNRLLVSRFNNEPYHYIQAQGVTVKYADDATVKRKINKQLLTAIGDMFAAGFRIWYEKPEDDSYKRMYVKEEE